MAILQKACQGMTDLGVLIWSLSVCLHSNHAQRWCWEKSYHWHYLHVSAIRTLPSFGNGAVLTCVCLHQLTTILISLPFSPINLCGFLGTKAPTASYSSTYAFKSLGPIADTGISVNISYSALYQRQQPWFKSDNPL